VQTEFLLLTKGTGTEMQPKRPNAICRIPTQSFPAPNPKTLRELKSWLYRVSTNIALDHLRRAKHETPVDAPISEDIEDSALPLDEEVERRRKAAKVRSAIDKLDETSRKIILLHYYAGMTVREISACTGISEGTVKSRLMKARKRLAVMLGEEAADEKKRKKK